MLQRGVIQGAGGGREGGDGGDNRARTHHLTYIVTKWIKKGSNMRYSQHNYQ